jgi:hypothetical protein
MKIPILLLSMTILLSSASCSYNIDQLSVKTASSEILCDMFPTTTLTIKDKHINIILKDGFCNPLKNLKETIISVTKGEEKNPDVLSIPISAVGGLNGGKFVQFTVDNTTGTMYSVKFRLKELGNLAQLMGELNTNQPKGSEEVVTNNLTQQVKGIKTSNSVMSQPKGLTDEKDDLTQHMKVSNTNHPVQFQSKMSDDATDNLTEQFQRIDEITHSNVSSKEQNEENDTVNDEPTFSDGGLVIKEPVSVSIDEQAKTTYKGSLTIWKYDDLVKGPINVAVGLNFNSGFTIYDILVERKASHELLEMQRLGNFLKTRFNAEKVSTPMVGYEIPKRSIVNNAYAFVEENENEVEIIIKDKVGSIYAFQISFTNVINSHLREAFVENVNKNAGIKIQIKKARYMHRLRRH